MCFWVTATAIPGRLTVLAASRFVCASVSQVFDAQRNHYKSTDPKTMCVRSTSERGKHEQRKKKKKKEEQEEEEEEEDDEEEEGVLRWWFSPRRRRKSSSCSAGGYSTSLSMLTTSTGTRSPRRAS